jgi:hypothetical protein
MSTSSPFDILIVGSGPAGVQAAVEATRRGCRVGLVEIGNRKDAALVERIPEKPFSEIRRTDEEQAAYFMGDAKRVLQSTERAGAHLTPPRQYMIRDAERLLPFASESFVPLQATSAGGLGVSWGAQVFTMTDGELGMMGLPVAEMRRYYGELSADIGVSGSGSEDGRMIADLPNLQPALDLDTNAQSIFDRYSRGAQGARAEGFYLAPATLAVLSEKLGDRGANRYADMDFYSDVGKSAYRPQHTLDELLKLPNFSCMSGRLAERFTEGADGVVRLSCRNIGEGREEVFEGRRLILAASAINSGRMALRSLGGAGSEIGILNNPNHWIVAINRAMLGRPAADRRHSFAQLAGLLRMPGGADDFVAAQFYSYRSLLFFRLLRDLPLPPRLGVMLMRFIVTAMTVINVHYPDRPAKSKQLRLKSPDSDLLTGDYELPAEQVESILQGKRGMMRWLKRLGLMPLKVLNPPAGASIHYAGTLPFGDSGQPFTCGADGALHGARNVYVADSASWRYLPAKGLTFTLMANARRVSGLAAASLKS